MIITILILISAFPVGYLLAYLCRDELISGRRWFLILAGASLIIDLILLFWRINYAVILSLFYIIIVSLVCYYLSYNKRFVG